MSRGAVSGNRYKYSMEQGTQWYFGRGHLLPGKSDKQQDEQFLQHSFLTRVMKLFSEQLKKVQLDFL